MGKTTHERRCFLTFKHGDFRWQTVRWPKGNGIMRGLFYDFMVYMYIHKPYQTITICWRNLGRRKRENCLEGIQDVTNLFWSIPAAWFPVDVPCSKVGFHGPMGRSRAMIAAKDTPDLSQYLLNLLEASLCWLVCGASAWFKRGNSTGIGW